MLFGMSLINSFTHIQENWKFVIICVQNQWGVVHPWHGTVANLWGRHKDFTEFNENFEKSYLLNGLSNIVKFFTVWFLKIFCIKWIHIFFWVQCSFNSISITTNKCDCVLHTLMQLISLIYEVSLQNIDSQYSLTGSSEGGGGIKLHVHVKQ